MCDYERRQKSFIFNGLGKIASKLGEFMAQWHMKCTLIQDI